MRNFGRVMLAKPLLAVSIFLVTLIFPLFAASVEAQTVNLLVISNSAKGRYGFGLSFTLQARSTRGEIRYAELRATLGKNPQEYIVGATVTPGSDAEARADLNYDKVPLTAGMSVSWYWIFTNSSGDKARTEAKIILYEDTRFNWKQRSGPAVTVRWYNGNDDYGSLMYVLANDALATYKRRFNITTTDHIYISIYGSSQEYRDAAPDVPSWSGGYTLAERNEILAIAPQNRMANVLIGEGIPHELSHAALFQHLGHKAPPVWLDEGFAVYNQNVIAPRYDQILQAAYRQNSLIPLASMNKTFPLDDTSAELAYAEGRSMVTFIINNYSDAVWANVLDQLRYGDIDRAMQKVLGLNLVTIEEQWRNWVGGKKFSLPPALLSGPVLDLPPANLTNQAGLVPLPTSINGWFVLIGIGGASLMVMLIVLQQLLKSRKPAIQAPVLHYPQSPAPNSINQSEPYFVMPPVNSYSYRPDFSSDTSNQNPNSRHAFDAEAASLEEMLTRLARTEDK